METKRQFKWFTIFQYDKEQEYLEKMHASGWKFTRVSGLGIYHFEKAERESYVYRLDYNKEGLADKEAYVQMFADCGWEYLQEYAGYCYFRKATSEAGESDDIFCDDQSRLQMMERVLKGRMLPLLIIFFCCLLPQFLINLLSTHNYVVSAVIGSILLLYVSVFATCASKYAKLKKDL